MTLFLALVCLPLTLGVTFAFYRCLRGSGVPEHTSLILGAMTMAVVSGAMVWMTLRLWG